MAENILIDKSTGRVMQAFTRLRATGQNAVQRKVRIATNTVANPDHKASGTGIGGMTSSVPIKNIAKLS